MKKTIFLSIAILVATTALTAQTADEIVNKYADAIGGKKKLQEIKNIYMEGSLNGTIPVKSWLVVNKMERGESTLNGMTSYSIVRTDSGWSFSPARGQKVAEPMTADEVKNQQGDLDAPGMELINYKEHGYKVTLLGKENIQGTDAFKVEEIISTNLIETYYIDPDTYYVIRIHVKRTVDGQTDEVSYDLSDYKKTPDGYVFAMSSSVDFGNNNVMDGVKLETVTKYGVVKLNIDMAPKLFRP